jgi:hypothetical protein
MTSIQKLRELRDFCKDKGFSLEAYEDHFTNFKDALMAKKNEALLKIESKKSVLDTSTVYSNKFK